MWFVFKLSNPMRLNTAGARKFQVVQFYRPRFGLNFTFPLTEERYCESTSKGVEVASKYIKVAKWYQSFWVVSFCYHHLFLRLTDTTKDRNYVWAMSHEFTWETQGSRKGHQQIWEGPCVCTKMTQDDAGQFFGAIA